MLSKALVSAAYRRKLDELAALGVDIHAVIPAEWREAGAVQRFEPSAASRTPVQITDMRLNGHFHLHYYPRFADVLRTLRPDLVHLDEEPFNFATFHGAVAARRLGIPFLFFSWQNLLRQYPAPFRDMERAVYRWSSGALAGSDAVEAVLRAKGYVGSVEVVPQFGVDADAYRPFARRPGPFTVGLLNRLTPGKAPLVAVAAFAALPDDCRLEIVGDGPLRGAVEASVHSLGIQHRVEMQERVPSDRMPELLSGMDVVLLPSVTLPNWKEQFGRVLIEAMAVGVPVVGTDSGEIPAVVGDAGLIVPEHDVGALAGALRRLHDDPGLRQELGRRGRERVLDRFTQKRIAEQTERAYRAALER